MAASVRVERVSIWFFDSTESAIECVDLYELSENRHSSGQRLVRRDYPDYFRALRSGRAIDAHDAREDPRTREFREGYLVPCGIMSMLDAAIRVDGKVHGVICLEHTGSERTWTAEEITFAGEAADQVAFALLCDERSRLRSLLEHAQRLESLGLLVGGIAHDFNNLLTVILGNVELAQAALEDSGVVLGEIDEALGATHRARDLTRKLLAFGRQQVLQRETVDLLAIVRDTVPLLRRVIPENIRIEITTSVEEACIEADRAELEQVIMNLCINSRDAVHARGLDESGTITISVDVAEPEVVLTVVDDGVGMSPEVRDRIFEPFFTTKEKEIGSGLGLAVIYGIVKQHDGHVEVESEPGVGTCFRLLFAKSGNERTATTGEMPILDEDIGRRRILVVDDDEAVGAVARRVLESEGHEVHLCSTAADAREAYARQDFDLLVLDVVLPDLTGPELAAELDPGRTVPVLFMSGHAAAYREHLVDADNVAFLQKPYGIRDLLKLVNVMIAS